MKIILICMSVVILMSSARAELFPEKRRHDPTVSPIIFEDPYTGFLLRTKNRTLGTVAGSIAIVTFGDEIIYGETGVEATLRLKGATFYSESLDLRVGIKWVHPFSKKLNLALGVSHTSGHVMDDVDEKSLIPYNVGIDGFPIRLVYDEGTFFRSGLHFIRVLGSEPFTRPWIGGFFNEFYPFSGKTNEGLYFGVDIFLPENYLISVSAIEQIGYAYHRAQFVVGHHNGADTRLKHELYLGDTSDFYFTGFKFEI